MTIQVHYYEQRDGVSVCKKCGTVENKDRIGPSWCSGRLPTVTVRQDDVAKLERERDEYRAAVDDVLAALYEATGDGQTYPLTALGDRVRKELQQRLYDRMAEKSYREALARGETPEAALKLAQDEVMLAYYGVKR